MELKNGLLENSSNNKWYLNYNVANAFSVNPLDDSFKRTIGMVKIKRIMRK